MGDPAKSFQVRFCKHKAGAPHVEGGSVTDSPTTAPHLGRNLGGGWSRRPTLTLPLASEQSPPAQPALREFHFLLPGVGVDCRTKNGPVWFMPHETPSLGNKPGANFFRFQLLRIKTKICNSKAQPYLSLRLSPMRTLLEGSGLGVGSRNVEEGTLKSRTLISDTIPNALACTIPAFCLCVTLVSPKRS